MSGFAEGFSTIWPQFISNPLPYGVVVVALLGAGWTAGRFMYSERITVLKERIDAYKQKLDGATPEEAEKRLAELEARVMALSPRRLTPQQLAKLATALTLPGSVIEIAQDMGAADARAYTSDFAAAFARAGWKVNLSSLIGIGAPPASGVAVRVVDLQSLTKHEEVVIGALRAADVDFDLQPGARPPQDPKSFPPGFQPPENQNATLLITSRST